MTSGSVGSEAGPIDALVLAAGRGERLRPLTDEVPKPALPLPGAPLGAWALEAVIKEFESVAVNVSHLPSVAIRELRLEGRAGVIDESPEPFGTGGTLAYIGERVPERIFVINADVLTDLAPLELVHQHARSGAAATVAVTRVDGGADFTVSGGRVDAFVDRRIANVPGARFIGASIFDRRALDLLSDDRPLGLGESLFPQLIARGELGAFEHRGYALDVGTPGRYLRACLDVIEGTAPAPPSGYREGRFVDVEGGRAYVESGAEVETSSLGHGAVILAGARVDAGASIVRSIVWPGEVVPARSEIDDSIRFRGRNLSLE